MNTPKILALAALSAALTPALAQARVDPSTFTINVYSLWLSLGADCTSPVKVVDNGTTGKTVNVAGSIDVGQGTLPADGSYKCMIIVLDDTNKFVPATTGTVSGSSDLCVAGTSYSQDTCGAGTSSALPDGTTTTCATGTTDKVAAYFSTAGTAGGESHSVATAKLLVNPIVVAGVSTSATFKVTDPDGLVDQNGSCGQDSNATLNITQ